VKRKRDWTITITQDVDIEVDLNEELSDDDLIKMAVERGLSIGGAVAPIADEPCAMGGLEWWERLADEIRATARAGDRTHLDILLLRMVDGTGLARMSIAQATTATKAQQRQ
jgi:hypothetical protein